MTLQPFHTAELDLYTPAPAALSYTLGHGTRPHGALSLSAIATDSVATLRYSDMGYVDPASHQPYPPSITSAFAIDRRLELPPGTAMGSETYGDLTLSNPYGALDSTVRDQIADHMPLRIYWGGKRLDLARGRYIDPSRDSLQQVFGGLGAGWQVDRQSVTVPLQDLTYWLSSAAARSTYGGSGGLDGDDNVAGRFVPRVRGQVTNITPVLIDAVNLVYQISDGPAAVSALYEGGYTGGIVSAGIVGDVYASPPAPGYYVVQSGATGTWLRLTTKPVYAITTDVTGAFPSGASRINLLDLLRQILLEDLAVDAAWLDPAWGPASDIGAWPAGWYWDGSDSVTGLDMIQTLLIGTGIHLVPTRRGTLLPMTLVMPQTGTTPELVIDGGIATDLQPVALDSALDPPAWRWRIGWQHNFSVQAPGSGIHPQAPADRQSLIAVADRTATWFAADVRSRYRVPNDAALIPTALLRQQDAQAVAASLGAVWGAGRRIWAVSVQRDIAYRVDIGSVVSLAYPAPGLTGGVLGIVIGEQIRSDQATSTIQVLV